MSSIDDLFRSILPPGVAVAAGLDASPDELPVEERAAVARAIPKRALEFARGRACARAALRELGLPEATIPVAPNRAPIWPAEVVGSITHCDGLVAAAVARAATVGGIGIDAEPARPPLEPGVVRLVCTEHERATLGELAPHPHTDWPRVVFGAKETVHKVVSPITGVMLGFHDVELDLDTDARSFAVRPARPRDLGDLELERLEGRFLVTESHVLTALVLPLPHARRT